MNNNKYKYVSQKGPSKPEQSTSSSQPFTATIFTNDTKNNNNNTKNNNNKNDNNYKNDNNVNKTNEKRGDGYENARSTPFPVLEPDLFYSSPSLMSDQEVAAFIVNGYHIIDTGLPDSFHDELYTYSNGKEISRFTNNPGNNVLPVIPSLEYVFECPRVKGALLSILGQDYMMHPHKHPHCNPPGFKGQQFHKDSFFGYELGRHHYPFWVMAMYYPQDTPVALGPTAISPTTQYLNLQDTRKRHLDVTKAWSTSDLMLECKKGTVVLIHYDLWHKGTPNLGTINRFMFKFQFMRMTPPRAPSWNNLSPEFPINNTHVLAPLHLQVWNWLRGDTQPKPIKTTSEERKKLYAMLRDTSVEGEPARLHAAYTLAHDAETVQGLFDPVMSEHQCVRRSALYGLSSSKDPEIAQQLQEILEAKRGKFPYKNELLLALSDMGATALSSLPAIFDALANTRDEHSSSAAAEALGYILFWLDPNDKSVNEETWQKDFYNAVSPAFQNVNEVVRFNTCISIARIGKLSVASRFVRDLERLATMDQNRYVRAYALEALERINTPESTKIALRILKSSHYCPVTTFNSTF